MSKPEIKVVKMRDDWCIRSVDMWLGCCRVNVSQSSDRNRVWEACRLNSYAIGSVSTDECEQIIRLLQVAIRKAKQWNKQRCGKKSSPPTPA